jgi:hypothetical protein
VLKCGEVVVKSELGRCTCMFWVRMGRASIRVAAVVCPSRGTSPSLSPADQESRRHSASCPSFTWSRTLAGVLRLRARTSGLPHKSLLKVPQAKEGADTSRGVPPSRILGRLPGLRACVGVVVRRYCLSTVRPAGAGRFPLGVCLVSAILLSHLRPARTGLGRPG